LEKLRSLIWLDEETLTFHSRFNIHVSSRYLREHLVFERFDNLAAAVQKRLEELVLAWVRAAVRKTGIRRFAFSGGVFMNVKMNQHILELPEVDAAWFQPAAGDESLVIGASTAMHLQQGMTPVPVETMNLGVRYTSEDVESFLRSHDMYARFKVERKPNMEDTIAELLAQFKVVARFKGAGEWGARSLGQRSILANGSDLKSFYMVNDMIKMRDFWMPFAPTILAEWAPRYIKNWDVLSSKVFDSSKYMILTFDSTPLAQHHLRAAIHQKDKTLRPQVLEEKDNPDLYRLLKYYEARTGMGGFLNTSFNLHGYPLVGTLEQALFTFENSGLEYLAIEDWLIAKQG
jgi:carbamoyltransferase